MNTNRIFRNVLVVSMLAGALPASAQLLGGGLGGAVGGTLNGTIGSGGLHGAGSAHGDTAADVSGSAGTLRDRAGRAVGKTREVGAQGAGQVRAGARAAKRQAGEAAASAEGAAGTAGNASVDREPGGIGIAGALAGEGSMPVIERNAAGRAEGRANASRDGVDGGLLADGGIRKPVEPSEPASESPQPQPAE